MIEKQNNESCIISRQSYTMIKSEPGLPRLSVKSEELSFLDDDSSGSDTDYESLLQPVFTLTKVDSGRLDSSP